MTAGETEITFFESSCEIDTEQQCRRYQLKQQSRKRRVAQDGTERREDRGSTPMCLWEKLCVDTGGMKNRCQHRHIFAFLFEFLLWYSFTEEGRYGWRLISGLCFLWKCLNHYVNIRLNMFEIQAWILLWLEIRIRFTSEHCVLSAWRHDLKVSLWT